VTAPTAAQLDEMRVRARAIRARAYAPYSKFQVGASILVDGAIYDGVNVENASYPLSVCAERNAIAAAIAAGGRHLEAVVVCTEASPPSSPCGGCRQVLVELAPRGTPVPVIAIGPTAGSAERTWNLADLLPDSFSGAELP
jgi:cytidine deaminase